jgi:branched-chain amino acid transport system substrate-binding protein
MFTTRSAKGGLPVMGLLFAGLLAGCSRSAPEVVTVGALLPLSGPEKAHGERARQGSVLAADEFNADDAHSAGKRLRVEYADTRGDPVQTQAEAVRLLTVNRVAALLADADDAGLERLARGVQPYSVPVLVSGELPPRAPGENLFSLAASPAYQGRVLAQFAATDLKAKRLVVLTNNTAAVAGVLSGAFVQEARQTKDVRVEERTYGKDSEFKEVVQRLQKPPPDAVLLAGSPQDLQKFRERLRTDEVNVPLLFGGAEGGWPPPAGGEAEGGVVYVSTVFAAEGLTPAGQEVARKYRKRFNQDLDVHAAQAYDSIRLLAETLRRAKATPAAHWREELMGLDDFESLTGPLRFDRDHNARRPVFVVRWEGRQAKLARKFDPEPK